MNKSKPTRYRKPDLMVLLAFFVGLGVLVTSFAQAFEPSPPARSMQNLDAQGHWPEQWLQSLWGLDLANRLKSWKPKITVDDCNDGMCLSSPFGSRGPVLQFSASVPEPVSSSSLSGGDDSLDAYLLLQKRW